MALRKGQNGKCQAADPVAPARGRLFKARAAAQYLGIKESHVRTLLGRGEIVALRTSQGRLIGIYESDCDAWVASCRRTPAPPPPPRPSVDERIAHLMPKERHFA